MNSRISTAISDDVLRAGDPRERRFGALARRMIDLIETARATSERAGQVADTLVGGELDAPENRKNPIGVGDNVVDAARHSVETVGSAIVEINRHLARIECEFDDGSEEKRRGARLMPRPAADDDVPF